jgi:hypothetical protein
VGFAGVCGAGSSIGAAAVEVGAEATGSTLEGAGQPNDGTGFVVGHACHDAASLLDLASSVGLQPDREQGVEAVVRAVPAGGSAAIHPE